MVARMVDIVTGGGASSTSDNIGFGLAAPQLGERNGPPRPTDTDKLPRPTDKIALRVPFRAGVMKRLVLIRTPHSDGSWSSAAEGLSSNFACLVNPVLRLPAPHPPVAGAAGVEVAHEGCLSVGGIEGGGVAPGALVGDVPRWDSVRCEVQHRSPLLPAKSEGNAPPRRATPLSSRHSRRA
jgi:peptide deformylase